MQDIVIAEPEPGRTRPPEPIPEPGLDNVGPPVHYDEPVSDQGPAPYDSRSGENPPDVPPPRKKSAEAANATPPKTINNPEGKGECSGPPLPPECQNGRASDPLSSDIHEKTGKSSQVILVPPRRLSEDHSNATAPRKNRLAKTPSSPLSDLRSPFDANMQQPAAGNPQQCTGSYSNSDCLDAYGYVKCIH